MKPQPEPSRQEVLAGLVERVTYHNEENGFWFCGSRHAATATWFTVIGHSAVISAGEWVTASGEWVWSAGLHKAGSHARIQEVGIAVAPARACVIGSLWITVDNSNDSFC
jgi:hypothetical protein